MRKVTAKELKMSDISVHERWGVELKFKYLEAM